MSSQAASFARGVEEAFNPCALATNFALKLASRIKQIAAGSAVKLLPVQERCASGQSSSWAQHHHLMLPQSQSFYLSLFWGCGGSRLHVHIELQYKMGTQSAHTNSLENYFLISINYHVKVTSNFSYYKASFIWSSYSLIEMAFRQTIINGKSVVISIKEMVVTKTSSFYRPTHALDPKLIEETLGRAEAVLHKPGVVPPAVLDKVCKMEIE
ncbi:hypothetical protein FQN52_006033 [Onygenales sp. PD_12]|nr:hypothetical protein FQN52_006033 [Onygenales sp. PD_12]